MLDALNKLCGCNKLQQLILKVTKILVYTHGYRTQTIRCPRFPCQSIARRRLFEWRLNTFLSCIVPSLAIITIIITIIVITTTIISTSSTSVISCYLLLPHSALPIKVSSLSTSSLSSSSSTAHPSLRCLHQPRQQDTLSPSSPQPTPELLLLRHARNLEHSQHFIGGTHLPPFYTSYSSSLSLSALLLSQKIASFFLAQDLSRM